MQFVRLSLPNQASHIQFISQERVLVVCNQGFAIYSPLSKNVSFVKWKNQTIKAIYTKDGLVLQDKIGRLLLLKDFDTNPSILSQLYIQYPPFSQIQSMAQQIAIIGAQNRLNLVSAESVLKINRSFEIQEHITSFGIKKEEGSWLVILADQAGNLFIKRLQQSGLTPIISITISKSLQNYFVFDIIFADSKALVLLNGSSPVQVDLNSFSFNQLSFIKPLRWAVYSEGQKYLFAIIKQGPFYVYKLKKKKRITSLDTGKQWVGLLLKGTQVFRANKEVIEQISPWQKL